MDKNQQLNFVKEQISLDIRLYMSRKLYDRRAALLFTVIPATLAALATVFIGVSERFKSNWLPILAMVTTGVSSIIGAWEALFQNRKLWLIDNAVLTKLCELQFDIEYREKGIDRPISQVEIDEYFERLKVIRAEADHAYKITMGDTK